MKKELHKKRKEIPVSPKKEKSSGNNLFIWPLWLQGLIIIALGFIIYSNSFDCSFHMDDSYIIVDNQNIRSLMDIGSWWGVSASRPVAFFTFAMNYHFHQLDVWGYHFVNIVIHIINAFLVRWLILLILTANEKSGNHDIKNKGSLATMAALLFLTHPLATASVTYIVQRMASLVTLFYLLSVALYLKARISEQSRFMKGLLFFGAAISALLAFETKENAFTLPLTIVMLEWIMMNNLSEIFNFKKPWIYILLGLFLSVFAFINLRTQLDIFKPITYQGEVEYTITPATYLFTEFSVILKYIQLLILPVNQNLDYNFPISTSMFNIRTLLSALGLLGLIFVGFYYKNKKRIVSFGIFWFLLTLLIESSIIPIKDVIFEHRTYLPSFGFFLIVSYLLYSYFEVKSKGFLFSVFILLISIYSVATLARNKVWKNDLTLWSDVVQKSPLKPRGLTNRGVALGQTGNWDLAIKDFSKVIQMAPRYGNAYSNRGVAYSKSGQYELAVNDYNEAIKIDSAFENAIFNRGEAYGKLGQYQNAIKDFTRVIQINPGNTNAYAARAGIYNDMKNYNQAIVDYSKSVQLDPTNAKAFSNRGAVYANLGDFGKALDDYNMAIKLKPDYKNAFVNRGAAYVALEKWNLSIQDFSKAIQLDPQFMAAYFNRAIAYGKMGDWDNSIMDYNTVLQLDPKFHAASVNRDIAIENKNKKTNSKNN